MTGISSYSTTASENVQANTGIDWDEGMSPGQVNNSARQNMADIRAAFDDLIWFQYGIGSKSVAHIYAGSTSTTIAGADVTAVYHAKRRVKAVGSITGTIYGSITSSSYAGSTTTVNYLWDSGSLSNETLTIYLSQVPVTGNPAGFLTENRYTNFGSITGSGYSTNSVYPTYVMVGSGSVWKLTPKTTGRVRFQVTGSMVGTSAQALAQCYYGTGTTPAQGASVPSGSVAGNVNPTATLVGATAQSNFTIYFEATGLTLGSAYWFDLGLAQFNLGSAQIFLTGIFIEEF